MDSYRPYNSRLAARYVFARQHCCHYRRVHPPPAFLPIFDYPGVTRGDACQDGGGRLRPL